MKPFNSKINVGTDERICLLQIVAFLYYEPIKPFKSYAPLAQLVEQLTLNQWIPGFESPEAKFCSQNSLFR